MDVSYDTDSVVDVLIEGASRTITQSDASVNPDPFGTLAVGDVFRLGVSDACDGVYTVSSYNEVSRVLTTEEVIDGDASGSRRFRAGQV